MPNHCCRKRKKVTKMIAHSTNRRLKKNMSAIEPHHRRNLNEKSSNPNTCSQRMATLMKTHHTLKGKSNKRRRMMKRNSSDCWMSHHQPSRTTDARRIGRLANSLMTTLRSQESHSSTRGWRAGREILTSQLLAIAKGTTWPKGHLTLMLTLTCFEDARVISLPFHLWNSGL
jgi:hypothetical protein